MSLVRTKTLIIYTVFLSLFSIFTGMFIEGGNLFYGVDESDKFSLAELFTPFAEAFGEDSEVGIIGKGQAFLSLFWKVPYALVRVAWAIISIPFLGLKYLPPIVSTFLYLPYMTIVILDVIIPLFLKIADIVFP